MENIDLTSLNPDAIVELVMTIGPRLLGALLVLFIGWKIIKMISRFVGRAMEKRDLDATLTSFIRNFIAVTLKILLIVSVLGMIGIQMTAFIAIIGAAGLAVGLALSGTLQNFAGGVLILMIRPFKVGDFIDALGYMGTVREIQIFNTILKTPDNKTVILPNGGLSTSSLVNFSTEPTRRVDWTFGIAYGDDSKSAREVLTNLVEEDQRILKDPAPAIVLSGLGDSSVNFTVRAWVNAGDFWPVFFEMNEKVYRIFPEKGLNIPFPQMDVHLHKTE